MSAPRAAKRVAILGNSGSGKTTLARRLAREEGLELLELDAVVWVPGEIAVPRPEEEAARDLDAFVEASERWVVEGCYAELVERALPRCTELLFLDPGLEACLANNRRRPWEPEKYASKAAQDAMLPTLLDWVRGYETRSDAWSRLAHERVFEGFAGPKRRLRGPSSS